MSDGGSTTGEERLCLEDRLALRPAEAARALGIGERTLRALLPKIPHIRLDSAVLIPKKMLERWLEERASSPADRAKEIAAGFTRTIRRSARDSNKS